MDKEQWTAEPNGIVTTVIDSVPPASIKIKYDSGVEVNQGNELTPTQVQNQPIHFEYPFDSSSLYTVVLIDPDAPTRLDQTLGEMVHWLVINVPGGDVSKGDIVSEYVGSGPSKGNGLHRYVFLVYKQSGKIPIDDSLKNRNRLDERAYTKIRQFATKHNLGQPIAGNLYLAQYDDYVPQLHAKFQKYM